MQRFKPRPGLGEGKVGISRFSGLVPKVWVSTYWYELMKTLPKSTDIAV